LNILFDDASLIAFNKPPGIGTQPDKTGDDSLLHQASIYCGQALHPVHRLDRPVSGITVFAKTDVAMTALTAQFTHRSVEKYYWAVVQTPPPEPEGTLVHFLKKNQQKNISTALPGPKPGAERAELKYRTLEASDRYTLLEIQLSTGKHHQIRAQLAAIGCPVKGDVKYGARRNNADRSIHLHAVRLVFKHPLNGKIVDLEAPTPSDALWYFFSKKLGKL
jgi:23S rRNA pseudouridine1911/1915/1917 synthase